MALLDIPIISLLILSFLSCYYFLTSRKSTPPGPLNLPFIGSLMFILKIKKSNKRMPVILAEEERQKYGDIIQLKFGSQRVVILHGYDVIQEAFVRNADIFSNRPHWLKQIQHTITEGKGILWQSGEAWKVLRKFTLQSLRDFGVGKTSLEEKIFLEIDSATDYLTKNPDQPVDIKHVSSMMISNIIYSIVFGKRFNFDDEEFHNLLLSMETVIMGGGPGSGATLVPRFILKLLDPKIKLMNSTGFVKSRYEAFCFIKQHIYKEIEKHETTFDKENIRDFVDLYVQAKTEKRDSEIYSVGNIFRVIMDLFLAGSETTSNTINWSILYMIEYPDVQKRCYDEIKDIYGDRRITWLDKGTLPYVEATLLEIQRISNVAQMTLPHTNEVDTTIQGYHIPKQTIVQANLYSVNMDERHWDKPQMFNPDRFIENGKLKTNPALIPFGIGPRICMGESLAKMEIFLVFTNLVQRLHFSREDKNVPHTFEAIKELLTTAPIPYMARVKRRS